MNIVKNWGVLLVIAGVLSGCGPEHDHKGKTPLVEVSGGTLCVIYPWQPYPSEYCKLKKQAEKEIRENHRPRLLPFETIPEGYDVIFIGTPCWRGRISPPAASFLERIQTDGKIVIPFCTHRGEERGCVEQDIAVLCPNAQVQAGFHVTNAAGYPAM